MRRRLEAAASLSLLLRFAAAAAEHEHSDTTDEEGPLGTRAAIALDPSSAPETVRAEAGTRLRMAPDPEAPALAIVDGGVDLEVLERRGSWVRVLWGQRLGWVPADPASESVQPWHLQADPQRLSAARAALGPGASEERVGPFLVAADAGADRLRSRLARLAIDVHRVYAERFGIEPALDVQLGLVLFTRRPEYRKLEVGHEAYELGAAGPAVRGVAAVFVGRRGFDEARPLFVHDATHLLNRLTLGRNPPAWIEEGLASDLSYCDTDASGRLIPGSLERQDSVHLLARSVRSNSVESIALLVDLPWNRFVGVDNRTLRYAQSAFLVRFLLDGEGGRWRSAFRGWLSEIGGHRSVPDLFSRLGTNPRTLDRDFRRWVLRTAQSN